MEIELFDHDTITGENIFLVMNLIKNIIAINLSNLFVLHSQPF